MSALQTHFTTETTVEVKEESKTIFDDFQVQIIKDKITVNDTPDNRNQISEKISKVLEASLVNLEKMNYSQYDYLLEIKQGICELITTTKDMNNLIVKKPDQPPSSKHKILKSEKLDDDKMSRTHHIKKTEENNSPNIKTEDSKLKKNKSEVVNIKLQPEHNKGIPKTKSERKIEPIKEQEKKRGITAKSVTPKESKTKRHEEEKKESVKSGKVFEKQIKTQKRIEETSVKKNEERKKDSHSVDKKKDIPKKDLKTPKNDKKEEKKLFTKESVTKGKKDEKSKPIVKNGKTTKEEKKNETPQKINQSDKNKIEKEEKLNEKKEESSSVDFKSEKKKEEIIPLDFKTEVHSENTTAALSNDINMKAEEVIIHESESESKTNGLINENVQNSSPLKNQNVIVETQVEAEKTHLEIKTEIPEVKTQMESIDEKPEVHFTNENENHLNNEAVQEYVKSIEEEVK